MFHQKFENSESFSKYPPQNCLERADNHHMQKCQYRTLKSFNYNRICMILNLKDNSESIHQ